MTIDWCGLYPAIITAFQEEGNRDLEFVARHAARLVENDCSGIAALGFHSMIFRA